MHILHLHPLQQHRIQVKRQVRRVNYFFGLPLIADAKKNIQTVLQPLILKEMIVFPLMYPEVFERFKINPPRGCLFYGPPGTGKTLVARALANECSHGDKKVAFFMRKGADCLSKWVGESERQLRLLFDQVSFRFGLCYCISLYFRVQKCSRFCTSVISRPFNFANLR